MNYKYGTTQVFAAFPTNDGSKAAGITPQEHVNLEMFKAIETLGRKLERAEGERDRMARRLAAIESAATLDETTGKYYLPVVSGGDVEQTPRSGSGWSVALSLCSTAIAAVALAYAVYGQPNASNLTSRQLAAINAIAYPAGPSAPESGWTPAPVETAGVEVESPFITPAAPETVTATASATAMAPYTVVSKPDETTGLLPPPTLRSAPSPALEPPPPLRETAEVPMPAPLPAPLAAPRAEVVVARTPVTIAADDNLPEELSALEQRAFENVAIAQHDLGTIYAAGKLVPQDFKRSAYWFSKAAEGGLANADYNLGVMYQQGLGVEKNMEKALDWYNKAAQKGNPEAMYNLGIAYVGGSGVARDVDRGVSYFKRAANAGVAQAAYNLGILYESTFIGPVDYARAVQWYDVAGAQGNQQAKAAADRLRTMVAEGNAVQDIAATEPASGIDEEAQFGEGDSSPPEEKAEKPVVTVEPTEDLLTRLQAELIKRKELPYRKPSGVLDSRTENAIRDWQMKLGLTVTGLPSQILLDKIEQDGK
ncbi:MAG: SEL1-like repeat protein [Alphaproteobacteria bacterium]